MSMPYPQGMGRAPFAFITAILSVPVVGVAGPITSGSAVLFNTVCAQCHELQCSQRLSFSSNTPAADARNHILNYAGLQDAAKVEELFALTEYTKTKCDYYAPSVAPPKDGIWSASALAVLATPSRTDWFVPLGSLSAGTWTLRLTLSSDQAVDIEVVTRLGLVTQERTTPSMQEAQLILTIREAEAGLPHFLRLRGRNPISFIKATLMK